MNGADNYLAVSQDRHAEIRVFTQSFQQRERANQVPPSGIRWCLELGSSTTGAQQLATKLPPQFQRATRLLGFHT
jgi:hypothetical protein